MNYSLLVENLGSKLVFLMEDPWFIERYWKTDPVVELECYSQSIPQLGW